MRKGISTKHAQWILLMLLVSVLALQAADIKWMRYGGYQAKVASTGDMGEGGLGWAQSGYIPYNGFGTYDYEGFEQGDGVFSCRRYRLCDQ